jgi:hypothetical protein
MDKRLLHHPRAQRIVLALAGLCFATFPTAARAAGTQADPFASSDTTDEAAYRNIVKDGVAEYDARHFEEARSLFRRAHAMNPNARTFRSIGMTSFELRDYVSAVHNLSASLQDQRKPLAAGQRKDAQDLLDRSRMFVDVYALRVSPAGARVMIDARTPEFEPDGTMLLGFGTHTVEATAQGMAPRSLFINVRGGERKEISLTLERETAARALAADAGAAQIRTTTKPSLEAASNRSAAAWLWAGGGAALLAAGASIYWLRQNSELNSCRNPTAGLRCTDESTIKTQRNIGLGVTVGAGAAALTMLSIGILSWHSKPSLANNHSALDCTVTPFGITCARSF